METVTIPKKEYQRLKKIAKEQIDTDLYTQLVQSLEDIKAGRVKLWKRTTKV